MLQGGPKKAPYFVFHPKVVFYIFLHIFQVVSIAGLGGSFDSNMDPTRCYTTQQRIKIIGAYFATNQFFWHSGNTGEILAGTMYNSTFDGQISGDRTCGRCPQRPQWLTSFSHNSWEYSEFARTPWGIPQKINTPSLARNWHFENISFDDPPWWH